MTRLQWGKTSHLLLLRACAEPLSFRELIATPRLRHAAPYTLEQALVSLRKKGLVTVTGQRCLANLYIITPDGEDELDRLFEAWGHV